MRNLNGTRTHGKSRTAEYRAWSAIKVRCYRKIGRGYPDYGGRGIIVCERWVNSFETFLNDMGPRPSPKHSLDRINNNGNYEPGNVRWATRIEQNNNTRKTIFVTIDGRSRPIQEWARTFDISMGAIQGRLKKGWSIEAAVKTKAWSRAIIKVENSLVMIKSE